MQICNNILLLYALFFLHFKIKCLISNAQYHQNDIGLFVHKHALADEDKYLVSNLYYDTC
jgi:hypothetical protein